MSHIPERKFIKEVCGDFGFHIFLERNYENIWIDFIVEEIVARGGKDCTEPEYDEKPYLKCTVKWDSCSHFWFGDEGYLHLCGVHNYKKHQQLMEEIYKTAFELMGIVPMKGEGWEVKA